MRALSTIELLDVWESSQAKASTQQALDILAVACPDVEPEMLAQLSIGERDARLLTLREWTFGSRIVGMATCPSCADQVELDFAVEAIRAAPLVERRQEDEVEVAGYTVRFRLPTSVDLEALAQQPEVAEPDRVLFERCALNVKRRGKSRSVRELPQEVVEVVEARMAEMDPQADVRLALSCPACHHRWLEAFDVVSFFCNEITAWAHRTLSDVHILASAYGWSEPDILSMSPWRRQIYLEMIQG